MDGGARRFRREHIAQAAVYIAAACAKCPLGPAAQLREDAAIRASAADELDRKIELAKIEQQNLILQAQTEQAVALPSAAGLAEVNNSSL